MVFSLEVITGLKFGFELIIDEYEDRYFFLEAFFFRLVWAIDAQKYADE